MDIELSSYSSKNHIFICSCGAHLQLALQAESGLRKGMGTTCEFVWYKPKGVFSTGVVAIMINLENSLCSEAPQNHSSVSTMSKPGQRQGWSCGNTFTAHQERQMS